MPDLKKFQSDPDGVKGHEERNLIYREYANRPRKTNKKSVRVSFIMQECEYYTTKCERMNCMKCSKRE